jgi:hypothetical protein
MKDMEESAPGLVWVIQKFAGVTEKAAKIVPEYYIL